MYGFRIKYIKSSLLLLGVLISLTTSWFYLSHGGFALVATSIFTFLLSGAVVRNAWMQARRHDPEPALAIAGPPRTASPRRTARPRLAIGPHPAAGSGRVAAHP
jgi:hypothetical protein